MSFTYGEGGQKGTTILLSGATTTTTYDDLSRGTQRDGSLVLKTNH